jgi:hypothetical protein
MSGDDLKAVKERLDVLEAGLEAAGYLVWNEKKAAFVTPATAAELALKDAEKEAAKKGE